MSVSHWHKSSTLWRKEKKIICSRKKSRIFAGGFSKQSSDLISRYVDSLHNSGLQHAQRLVAAWLLNLVE
jgi:hypothetical protein